MTPIMLDDEAVRARLEPGAAVAAMRQAMLDVGRGDMLAPPRVSADLGGGRMVFTAGAHVGRWFGYRSYDTFGLGRGEQVVVLHGWQDGAVQAIALGGELGARRTGAIGGVAVDTLASPGARRVAVIGTGTQAWTQLWAVGAVRKPEQVLVWSRDAGHRASFAARARADLGMPATEAAGAEQAVRESDIVVLATSSTAPVVRSEWVQEGSHVTTLGPQRRGRTELDPRLADRSRVIATDSPAQVRAYRPPFMLEGTPHLARMVSLASVISGSSPGRGGPDDITLFCSAGLAGTEVHLLAALLPGI